MADSLLKVEKIGNIYILTVNRPHALNALNSEVFDLLDSFFITHKNDYDVKGVIITGSGDKAFVAGADIKEFASLDAKGGAMKSRRGQDVFFLIEEFHAPVIAAVNGFALGGGCELAMACHIRVAANNAKFGQPEVNLGLVTGYGGTQRLVQLIGKGRALELLMTADMIDAERALQWGLVNHVVPPGEVVNKSIEILSKISTKAPLAIQYTIALVNSFYGQGKPSYYEESKMFGLTMESEDGKEGAAAFVEKRKANFKAQ